MSQSDVAQSFCGITSEVGSRGSRKPSEDKQMRGSRRWAVMRLITLALLALASVAAQADTKFGIKTVDGVVSFVVGDDWPVAEMKTKDPVQKAVFQIPNPADQGTQESTLLVLWLCDLDTEAGRASFEKPVKQYGAAVPTPERLGEWIIYRQRDVYESVEHTILDAKRRSVADVAVKVRLA